MGGLLVEYEENGQTRRERLEPENLYRYFRKGSLSWPIVEDVEIDDRSKTDGLVKLLALTQILWFVAQVIGRLAQRLAVTTLELFTLGIVMWAVIIYAVLWKKPFDVRQPIVVRVQAKEDFTVRENEFTRASIMIDPVALPESQIRLCYVICAVVSLGFSALHIAAWSFHFSTSVELWLWRVNSISCTIVPLIMTGSLWFDADGNLSRAYAAYYIFLIGIYTIGRLYMFGEMFAGLRAAPPGIYQTPQWSQYFPSFG
jgi:hypothetical protein